MISRLEFWKFSKLWPFQKWSNNFTCPSLMLIHFLRSFLNFVEYRLWHSRFVLDIHNHRGTGNRDLRGKNVFQGMWNFSFLVYLCLLTKCKKCWPQNLRNVTKCEYEQSIFGLISWKNFNFTKICSNRFLFFWSWKNENYWYNIKLHMCDNFSQILCSILLNLRL